MIGNRQPIRVAFLGPEGTFSHQAAYDRFGSLATYLPQETISATFDSVSSTIPLGLLPLENSTHGQVTETYDLLRSPRWRQTAFVRGEITLRIRHALLVRKGVALHHITRVLSHEQALGQCTRWLATHIPRARIVPTTSTAAAARIVLSSAPESGGGESAAICSTLCAELYDGLDVLHEDIQDEQGEPYRLPLCHFLKSTALRIATNETRFLIFSYNSTDPLPSPKTESHPPRALIRIPMPPLNSTLSLETLVSDLAAPSKSGNGRQALTLVHMDRRPALRPLPWTDVYLLEVEQLQPPPRSADGDDRGDSRKRIVQWRKQLEEAIENVRARGGDAEVLGVW